MAYLDKNEYIPVFLPDWLPSDILEDVYLGVLAGLGAPASEKAGEPEPANGYIIHDWFGPFLLSPPSWFVKGRC